jgi:hypothetical protein
MAKSGGLHKGYRNIPKQKKFKDDKEDSKRLHSLQQAKRQHREEKAAWRPISNKARGGKEGKTGNLL